MNDIIIVGTGAQGRCALDVALEMGRNVLGFIDVETTDNVGKRINGIKVIGVLEHIYERVDPNSIEVVIGYGNTRKKAEVVDLLGNSFTFASLISPSVYISPTTKIGAGSIIHPMVVIMANTSIGQHVKIDPGCTIAHDNVIEDYVSISPNAALAGYVKVGMGSYIYTGANVAPRVTIGKWSVVGVGTAVIKDVPDETTTFGYPSRILKSPSD